MGDWLDSLTRSEFGLFLVMVVVVASIIGMALAAVL